MSQTDDQARFDVKCESALQRAEKAAEELAELYRDDHPNSIRALAFADWAAREVRRIVVRWE